MANLETEHMNTNESHVQNLEELGGAEALSKVTGGLPLQCIAATGFGSAAGAMGVGAAGYELGKEVDKKGSTGKWTGLGAGAGSGAVFGAAVGYKLRPRT